MVGADFCFSDSDRDVGGMQLRCFFVSFLPQMAQINA
jgi:hypothetical protein